MSTDPLPPTGGADRVAASVDRLAGRIARHWLAIFSAITLAFIALPFLAPTLMKAGLEGPARLIYTIYRPTCHQLPDRSFFLFGPQTVYSVEDLETAGAIPAGLNTFQRLMLRYTGNDDVGYKVALCERDIGIYTGILIGGISYGILNAALRRRGRQFPRMRWWVYALTVLPIAVDGLTQLFGFRESNWLLRLITGFLFGFSSAWLLYPAIGRAMDDIARSSAARNSPAQTGQNSQPAIH